MGRSAKLYRRLDALTADFARQLAKHVDDCVQGRSELLFWSREFLPDHYPRSVPTDLADALLATVEQIRDLHEKVREPFEESLAWHFREACRRWADHSDPHRGSAQGIARRLQARMALLK